MTQLSTLSTDRNVDNVDNCGLYFTIIYDTIGPWQKMTSQNVSRTFHTKIIEYASPVFCLDPYGLRQERTFVLIPAAASFMQSLSGLLHAPFWSLTWRRFFDISFA